MSTINIYKYLQKYYKDLFKFRQGNTTGTVVADPPPIEAVNGTPKVATQNHNRPDYIKTYQDWLHPLLQIDTNLGPMDTIEQNLTAATVTYQDAQTGNYVLPSHKHGAISSSPGLQGRALDIVIQVKPRIHLETIDLKGSN